MIALNAEFSIIEFVINNANAYNEILLLYNSTKNEKYIYLIMQLSGTVTKHITDLKRFNLKSTTTEPEQGEDSFIALIKKLKENKIETRNE